jgi:hypothetical protein
MMERAFVIAAFGDREKQVRRLIKNIRTYSDWPIHILATDNTYLGDLPSRMEKYTINIHFEYVKPVWTGQRSGVRNSNYHKIAFAMRHHYHSLCMLDDDMYIVDPAFKDGFAMAERFGAAIPINPRTFNHYNLMGADVRHDDILELGKMGTPTFIPAVNFSPFFVNPLAGYAGNFLIELRNQLRNVPCRGTVAIIKAMWKSHYTPVILPEQWCVCTSNAEHIKNHTEQLRGKDISIPTIMLHLGHDKVKEVYNVE